MRVWARCNYEIGIEYSDEKRIKDNMKKKSHEFKIGDIENENKRRFGPEVPVMLNVYGLFSANMMTK